MQGVPECDGAQMDSAGTYAQQREKNYAISEMKPTKCSASWCALSWAAAQFPHWGGLDIKKELSAELFALLLLLLVVMLLLLLFGFGEQEQERAGGGAFPRKLRKQTHT